MSDIQYMTQEGYTKLKEDLEELRSTGRQEASRAIAEARDKGDLSKRRRYTISCLKPKPTLNWARSRSAAPSEVACSEKR